MRSILEKAIVHLLNEEHEQAEALFHKFMVTRARQIHESLRQSEDSVLEENWNEEVTNEEYFTEDDLSDLEDKGDKAPVGDEDGAAPAGDDFGGEDDAAPAGDDFGGEDDAAPAGDDFGGEDDGMGGDEAKSDDERISDLEDQLERLTAEFDSLMSDEGDMGGDDMGGDDLGADGDLGGDDMGGDDLGMGGDDMGGDDFASDEDVPSDDVSDDEFGAEKPVHESEDEDEDDDSEELDEDEDFDDVTESIVSELEKVSVTMTDGKEIASGKSFSQNNTSVALQKKPSMNDAKPVSIKASEHKGFERETAPSVKDMKKRRNTKSRAEDGRSSVSKEGDKSAMINKDFGKGGEANTKSPLAKR